MDKEKRKPAVALDSLGCKLNQAETQQLAEELAGAGYRIVGSPAKADIYILNTCTVTHVADHKSRHMLRLAGRLNPAARLIAIGCYAQRDPQELKAIKGVEMALGNDRKMDLVKLLGDCGGRLEQAISRQGESLRRSRVFIKVQDGCKSFCTYCIVPFVRPNEMSVPVENVVARVKKKADEGFQEAVLTGTEIGNYSYNRIGLEGLVRRILEETGVSRLRLSSLQPHHISPGLVELWRDARLCPHFHLSLQSGSDSVLKRMNRRYSPAEYRGAAELIREHVPDAAITTDVMVGFPGETDGEFRETVEFCRGMKFARIHVFPFSSRPGTAASKMPGRVPEDVVKERSRQMLDLAKESAREFKGRFIGRRMDVLREREQDGVWSGLTGNYMRVYGAGGGSADNRILAVKLKKTYRDGLWGDF